MRRRLSDLHRTAFVTGAASGLGRAFSGMLLAEGVRVWGTSRDLSRFSEPGPAGGNRVSPVLLDLADPAGAEAAYRRAAAEAGGFDLVINNAGYGVFGDFAAIDAAVWRAQVEAMLVATLGLTHAAYREMRVRGRGCLVNVSSLAAEFPLPYMAGYNTAKAGLSALSESLIQEARGSGVAVIDFRPGDYNTGFNDAIRRDPAAAGPGEASVDRAWRAIDAMFRGSPEPGRAAADLLAALRRNRSGIVRSGGFFQARAAPFLARLVPACVVRAASRRYFGGR
jgi:short-subunit dehydrogenase